MLCKAAAIVSHLASGIAYFEENAQSTAELTTIRTDLQLQAAVYLFPWSQSFLHDLCLLKQCAVQLAGTFNEWSYRSRIPSLV